MTGPHFREYARLTDLVHPLGGTDALDTDAVDQLARAVEDPAVPLGIRLAAGTLLSLCGDPRIGPVPALTKVVGGPVEIGLAPESVAEVVARWRHVGVEASWIEKETPVHTTVLEDFWIGRYPVTNLEYREFLLDTGREPRPSTWYLGAYPWDRANHPVAGVSAEDADAYVGWLAERTGRAYRLPTEAEWEHAAKGFTGLEFPWGDEFSAGNANTRETGLHTTSPVGAFPGGYAPCGAADMAGNVEEYVADGYAAYPGGRVVEDHLVLELGGYRVTRGGSFSRYGDLARTRRRHGSFPSPLYPCGFRVATTEP